MRAPRRFAVLSGRNFRLLFVGQLLSNVGDQMTPVAITFAVLNQGGTARQVGWVLGAPTLTRVVFLLTGGVIGDRLGRRRVMLTADLVRFAVQASAAGLLLAGGWRLWQLVVLQGAWGAAAAFFSPSLTGLVPELVVVEQLQEANALTQLSFSGAVVVGPAVAGALVATVGAGPALAVDAATFLVSAVTLSRLRLPVAARTLTGSLLTSLREGWDAFRSRTWLWATVLQFSLWHVFVFAPVIVLGAVVAKQHLGGAGAWGTILATFGVGSVAGGLAALRLRPARPLASASLAIGGFCLLPVLFAVRAPLPLDCIGALAGGAGFAVFGTLWDTTMQREIPAEQLSRVSSYDWFGSTALAPVGYALVGPVSAAIGVAATLWVAAGWQLFVVVALLLTPGVTGLTGEPVLTATR